MKAKITFNLPEDMYELQNFVKATDFFSVILELNAFLDINIADNEISEHEQAVYSIVKKEFKKICRSFWIDIFETDEIMEDNEIEPDERFN